MWLIFVANSRKLHVIIQFISRVITKRYGHGPLPRYEGLAPLRIMLVPLQVRARFNAAKIHHNPDTVAKLTETVHLTDSLCESHTIDSILSYFASRYEFYVQKWCS